MTLEALTMEILEKLMAQDTVNPPGNERRGAVCLKEIFDREWIDCQIQDLGENRANFIAQIGSGRPILEFSGHLDVVPCVGEWTHPPIQATQEGAYIYGRGACDMKGGVAAMCAAAILLHRSGKPLHGTLRLVFVADEEHANKGMHAFLDSHEAADYTVLGEPTDLHVAIAHRGVARDYIDLHGHACHAALRTEQESSVTQAARAVLAIGKLDEELLAIRHPILPPPSIVVTQMQGYEKDNVVPGTVRLLTDFRVLPGMTEQEARSRVDAALAAAGLKGYTFEKRFYMPGGEVSADEPFVGLCCEVASQTSGGREETPRAFDASCEQCFLVEAGSKTVVLGPGSLEQAHTIDEFVEKEQLLSATALYQDLAIRVLVQGELGAKA